MKKYQLHSSTLLSTNSSPPPPPLRHDRHTQHLRTLSGWKGLVSPVMDQSTSPLSVRTINTPLVGFSAFSTNFTPGLRALVAFSRISKRFLKPAK